MRVMICLCLCLLILANGLPVFAQEGSIGNATSGAYAGDDSAFNETPKGTLDFSTTTAKVSFVIFLVLLGVGYYYLRRPPEEIRYSNKKRKKLKKKKKR